MANDNHATPQWLFDAAVRLFYPFDLDVCADAENHKCARWITKEQDGLKQAWALKNWCNPPYSDPKPWVEKAAHESWKKRDCRTVMLLPADLSTKWFAHCWISASRIVALNHRVKFEGSDQSAKFASMLVEFSSQRGTRPIVELVDLRHLIPRKEEQANASVDA